VNNYHFPTTGSGTAQSSWRWRPEMPTAQPTFDPIEALESPPLCKSMRWFTEVHFTYSISCRSVEGVPALRTDFCPTVPFFQVQQFYVIYCIDHDAQSVLNRRMKAPCCPRCFAQLVLRKSRLTTYLACPNYPYCKSPACFTKQPSRAQECRAAA
jgi:hypothetical protein